MMKDRYQILLPLPAGGPYDYHSDTALVVGDYVEVPFAGRTARGVVWAAGGGSDLPDARIKTVTQKFAMPPMLPGLRHTITWLADYTMQPIGSILKLALPVDDVFAPPKRKLKDWSIAPIDIDFAPATLSAAQNDAFTAIEKSLGSFQTFLLDGVTGSGKTEVYFEAAARAMQRGQQALLLLPEIALTNQMTARFAARFGAPPVLWHSHLTPAQRRENWLAIQRGDARMVIGALSALFLPFPNLGLIIVDEEHDASYKQEDGISYHARDAAVMRAKQESAPCLLVSATPSVETIVNAERGKYTALHLPVRYAGAQMPELKLVDLRKDAPPRQQWLSPTLREAITKNLAAGEQTLLFLNRRGYAPLMLCRACGERVTCKNCSSWMVLHKADGQLHCHHCGRKEAIPKKCKNCDAEDKFAPSGPGVERVAEEVAALWPDARVAILSSDHEKDLVENLQKLSDRRLDIVIGTQLLAKGHHFPNLTLVGVVDGDLGLSGADPRASERTYQLLHQVSGRAGRAELPGQVFIQSYQPEHPVLQALLRGDRDGFLQMEITQRQAAGLPPFGRLAAIILAARKEDFLHEICKNFARQAPKVEGLRIYGPAPAMMSKVRGQYRMRFIVIAPPQMKLQPLLRDWLRHLPKTNALRVQVDIDPQQFG
jgi:primosomal protein N' (replication factor Y)